MQTIIGREKEISVLKQLFQSLKAEFLALYGRRRIGKTFLIRNFFEKEPCIFFYCSGLKDGKLNEQLAEFAKQIGMTFYGGASITARKNWKDAFEDFHKAIEQVSSTKKVVLFFDELPWMATPKSNLLQVIDYYWNRYWTHDIRLKLIVCGSSASWIIKKIINNTGGLYNRVTRTMNLDAFSLHETEKFLLHFGIKLNHCQLLELYMIFGGVPHYLSLLRKGISAAECVDELCFQKGGTLVNEFERLFGSLFKNEENYIRLIRMISKFPSGIGQAELIKKSESSDGGRTKKRLKELEETGFIIEFIPHGHKEKGLYYKIIDAFTLFYLRWIEPSLKTALKQDNSAGYWLSKTNSASWKIWAGLAFESVCYKHIAQIIKAFNIQCGAEVGSWRYVPRKLDTQGAQIDLLFDRDDGVITICEIKHHVKPFSIGKEYAKKLLNKIDVYKKHSKTKKQLFLVMITTNGLKSTIYSEKIIDGAITLEDLFLKI